MSDVSAKYISGSYATFDDTFHATARAMSAAYMQSLAVTRSGFVWLQRLVGTPENPRSLTMPAFSAGIDMEERNGQLLKNQTAIQLLRSWWDEDEQEQRKTWEALKKGA